MSWPPASLGIGADESQYYIMQLAFVPGTSHGKHGPQPSFRLTHWAWHMPNTARP